MTHRRAALPPGVQFVLGASALFNKDDLLMDLGRFYTSPS